MDISVQNDSRQALALLTEKRLLAFIVHIKTKRHILAVQLINKSLRKGESLESLFLTDASTFSLEAEQLSPLQFHIKFGCYPGDGLGDGGEWDVLFNDDGSIVSAKCVDAWNA